MAECQNMTHLILVVLFSLRSQSEVLDFRIGDKAVYDVQVIDDQGQATNHVASLEIIGRSTSKYKVREIYDSEVKEYFIMQRDLALRHLALRRDDIAIIFSRCGRSGYGEFEIVTSPVGTVSACRISNENGSFGSFSATRIGPFHIIKKVIGPTANGISEIYLLRNYEYGI